MLRALKDFWNGANLKNTNSKSTEEQETTKNTAKERLHVLLVQDRASVSADFIDLMKEEVIQVIKKYVVADDSKVEISMTNSISKEGQKTETGLYIKIPIINIRNEMRAEKLSKKNAEILEELTEKKKEAIGNVLEEVEEIEKIATELKEAKETLKDEKQEGTIEVLEEIKTYSETINDVISDSNLGELAKIAIKEEIITKEEK